MRAGTESGCFRTPDRGLPTAALPEKAAVRKETKSIAQTAASIEHQR